MTKYGIPVHVSVVSKLAVPPPLSTLQVITVSDPLNPALQVAVHEPPQGVGVAAQLLAPPAIDGSAHSRADK